MTCNHSLQGPGNFLDVAGRSGCEPVVVVVVLVSSCNGVLVVDRILHVSADTGPPNWTVNAGHPVATTIVVVGHEREAFGWRNCDDGIPHLSPVAVVVRL